MLGFVRPSQMQGRSAQCCLGRINQGRQRELSGAEIRREPAPRLTVGLSDRCSIRAGPVAIYVGIDWRVFGRHEAIRSCGEVNDLIVWFLGEGLPSVDLAHGDLS